MPNSERVARGVTEAVVGPQYWVHGQCASMPDDLHEQAKLAAVGVLELVARAVDWPRLLQEAEWRHRILHPDSCPADGGASYQPLTRDVCGPCLREALLAHGAPGHCQDWRAEPEAARRAGHIDWPAVFSRLLVYRSPDYRRRLVGRSLQAPSETGN